MQLEVHGYVLDDGGKWRMRVPLFDTWLRHYKDAFNLRCSGSPMVGVGLANGGRFGLTLCDKGLDGWLMLNDNGLTLADKGSPTAQPAHAC
jgi:hypothetical protein